MDNVFAKVRIRVDYEKLILLLFILIKLTICAYPFEYGYFRDELYYISLSHHLDWGYVDVPPLLPLCIALLRHTIGNSLFALHLFSGITGAISLLFVWLMIRRMGGKIFSQILGLACATLAPAYVSVYSMCIYDSLNGLFWAASLYYLVSLLTTDNKKYWIYFGVAAGLGIMSKFDIFWLAGGLMISMIFTPQRKYFFSSHLWLGGLIALLIASPYLIWISQHFSLVAEYYEKYHYATHHISILENLKLQTVMLNPVALIVWIAGIYYFLFNKNGKKFRLCGIAFFIIMGLCFILHTKFYLSLPYVVVLFAGGAVFIESYLSGKNRIIRRFGVIYTGLIIVSGIFYIPYIRPVLPMNYFLNYAQFASCFFPDFQTEKDVKNAVVPQYFADRFGWEEMVSEIGAVYNNLLPQEKKRAVIIVKNYGEASAVNFYGKKYNLPPVICGHLQYYLWMPDNLSDEATAICFGFTLEQLETIFENIEQAGRVKSEYAIYYENNQGVYLCRGFKTQPDELLQSLKDMHM